MAEVRATAGVPIAANFAGFGAPTVCAPLVVNSATGDVYSITSTGTVIKVGPTAGVSATIATAKLTGGGTDGSMTFVNGVLTVQVAAT